MIQIQDLARRASVYAQRSRTSFLRHHSQYLQPGKIEEERCTAARYEAEDLFNSPANKLGELLAENPQVRGLAIDIGAGAGWCSAKLAGYFEEVVAIEPSAAAAAIARSLYPPDTYPNITWHVGFAEDILLTLRYTTPILFVTGVVLSHLRDKEAAMVCKEITRLAPKDSLLSFNEVWGEEWHQRMWHIRTKYWWQQQLPGWRLDFHGPAMRAPHPYQQGFHGIRI